MACLFYTLSISIICSVFFLVFTGSPSFAKSNYNNTFYLGAHENVTWYSNKSEIMNGWNMTVILTVKNHGMGFYFGLYSSEMRYGHLLSVVAVGEGSNTSTSHTVVWSSDKNLPVGANSYAVLSDGGFVLVDHQNGEKYDVLYPSDRDSSVAGMKLTEEGNLVLLGSKGDMIWQSFDNPVDTLLVGQRLHKDQMLANYVGSFAGITKPTIFSVFVSAGDTSLIYYQLQLDENSTHPSGLHYREDSEDGFFVNFITSGRSSPLEFIEFVKLDSDGHLRRYKYKYSSEGIVTSIVDITTSQCPTSQDGYHLIEVKQEVYFNLNGSDVATESVATLSGCQKVCMENCSCSTALFSYENNDSDGNCYMSSDILSREVTHINYNKSHAFIKALDVIDDEFIPDVLPPTPSPSPSPAKGENTRNAPPPTLPSASRHRKKLALVVSASTAGGLIVIVLIVLTSLVMLRMNQLEKVREDDLKQVPGVPLRFSFEELEIATENFKVTLGSGGFGSVFKGLLVDGTMVAVKRLDRMSQDTREFLAEVETIGSIHHFNLVRLVGFCAENSVRLLVYEYMTNGSLDSWIFQRDQARCLDWQTRKKVILDIAKGLAYLHEDCRQRIIHLDIKPHNILLDENFNAKVSDFGLSKLIARDVSQVLTPMRGTPGYLAPELQRSIVTVKADVYSFGIVILEIVSKRRIVDSSRSESSFYLLTMLEKKAEEDQLIDIVEDFDEHMRSNREEVVKMIRIGVWCLQNNHRKRPSMSTVVKVLEGVMEVEPNISYKFSHAMVSASVANDHITVAPQASILSAPR